MYKCERCGKGLQVGMNVSHSHRRTKKRSYPNLHKATLTISNKRQTMWLCTKCLRTVKKQATSIPAGKVQEPKVEAEIKVEEKESHTLSEDIEKAADARTLSEDIQKAAAKASATILSED